MTNHESAAKTGGSPDSRVVINPGNHFHYSSTRWQESRGDDYRHYRQQWDNRPRTHESANFPLHLDLDITTACNLKCRMCARTILKPTKVGQLSLTQVKAFIDQGAEEGLASVKFNFQGEPLLHPELADMVAYAKCKGIIDTAINTNGMLMTAERAAELMEAGLDNIFVSLDSTDKETLESIRIGADYELIVDHILNLVRIKSEKQMHHVQIGVNMVVMDENRHQVDSFVEQWTPVVDTVTWGWAHPVRKESRRAAVGEPECGSPALFCCPQLWQRMVVCTDGKCLPCCVDYERSMPVGNAFRKDLGTLWRTSEVYQQLRAKHRNGCFGQIGLCRDCYFAVLSSPAFSAQKSS